MGSLENGATYGVGKMDGLIQKLTKDGVDPTSWTKAVDFCDAPFNGFAANTNCAGMTAHLVFLTVVCDNIIPTNVRALSLGGSIGTI